MLKGFSSAAIGVSPTLRRTMIHGGTLFQLTTSVLPTSRSPLRPGNLSSRDLELLL